VNRFVRLDWFYSSLLRSGNTLTITAEMKVHVPNRRCLSHDDQHRLLPIDQTATGDALVHLLESKARQCLEIIATIRLDNKIIFLNGPPAIGKSIRV
jgi:hypothetical protein